jgi:tryptophan 2,3-dioxygenase
MVTDPAVTYASYLKIDELLALQEPRSQGPEHDELLFIVIHQVHELWFKELLHAASHSRRAPRSSLGFRRRELAADVHRLHVHRSGNLLR